MRFTWREIRDRPHTVIARLRAYIRASASRNASSSGSSIE
jgi:hypothetical protein